MTHESHTLGAGGMQEHLRHEAGDDFESWCDRNEERVLVALYDRIAENPDDHPFTVAQIHTMRLEIEQHLYERETH